MSNTAGVLYGTGTAYSSGTPGFRVFLDFVCLCSILAVSLDCPFLIVRSVFSKV
jgi:hypothetical protein